MYKIKPLVSIIVLSYNNARYIVQSVDSVLNQTYKNIEIIFADDLSTDNSREILNNYYSKYPDKIKLSYQIKNNGISKNVNDAIKISKGKYIAFISTDDWWSNDIIETEIKIMEENPNIGFCHTKVYVFNENSQLVEKESNCIVNEGTENIFHKLMKEPFVNALTVMVRKESLKKAGEFDETMPFLNDYDMWIRLSVYYDSYFINKPLAYYRMHNKNFTLVEQAKGRNAVSYLDYGRMFENNVKLYLKVHPDANRTLLAKYFHNAVKTLLSNSYYRESIRLEKEVLKTFPFVPIIWFKLPIFIIKLVISKLKI